MLDLVEIAHKTLRKIALLASLESKLLAFQEQIHLDQRAQRTPFRKESTVRGQDLIQVDLK